MHKFLVDMGNNTILQKDMEDLAAVSPILRELSNVTVLVTGATGLIGRHCISALMALNDLYEANVRVVALVRNHKKAEALFQGFLHSENLQLVYADLLSDWQIEEDLDYIIHGASATDSSFFVEHPVETIDLAINGTKKLLDLAKNKQVRSMVYLSSLEVYGTTSPDASSISEKDYGYLDPTSVRSSYSESKRMAESLCVGYCYQYQVPVRMARLSQTFGPGVSYEDNRVFAQFARAVLEKRDIILRTKGETVRNYCYTKDAIEAIFYILLKGQAGQAYNVANKETAISIREMAEMVIELSGSNESNLVFDLAEDVEKLGYNPTVKIRLNTDKLESLGWQAHTDLETMFLRLIESMAADRKE
ncbi:NAD-dependent epimerase/dehydratase family protein [Streptococcus sanguinis]|uniref:NAD-dependent epimerase/dehydratase n=1 Tax=Streptococcus sanguinis SK160 TaxID=888812 RepID=F0IS62_STRSA|nr:NAD-dependent epimerase/dehydratase family protein [Streptococcus sanguinis]EGD39189.1 NAD-dependent epimerase/dehydratase [Streptococcus sanguinis SK160]MCY7038384.1 NAD-dependent epimerase/dehydratase family protein [Streptococcus sanguinis]